MSTDVNVKVAVRCRPMNSRETQLNAQGVVHVLDGKTVVIRNPSLSSNTSSDEPASGQPDSVDAKSKTFTFDYAYFSDSTQPQVYDAIAKPLVDQALLGYNGTIFAYGQTGSGKTHTMMGTDSDPGIIPRMNHDLFDRMARLLAAPGGETKFLVTVSFLEIYNEVIKDLLNPSDKVLKIREHPDMGIYVEQLAELVVKDPADVVRLLAQGNKVRQVAATQMNERSSRSHSCFTIKIASKQIQALESGGQKEICVNAKINLVDLAGSERATKTGATGDRLKEGAAINKSLSALGNVITMLADPKKKSGAHVPYRDSKLTRLLQESLGGNSLTVMVAAISPADDNYDESLGTLQYANRAKAIKNAAHKNEDINEKTIRELREEIERLRQLVRPTSASGNGPSGSGGGSSESMMMQMEETIANLERAKQASWEEKQRLTELFEQERLKSLHSDTAILGFMQTIKQEKMDIMKRIQALQQQKLHVTKQLRLHKQSFGQAKTKLQQQVETFQQTSSKLTAKEKQAKMDEIEATKTLVVNDREQLTKLREELQICDEKLIAEEAEVAAASALLDEDEKLRKAIQEDEREKMKHEREAFLQSALDDERRVLQLQADEDKLRLEETLHQTADKEKQLFEEVERQRERALHFQQQLHAVQCDHAKWKADAQATLMQMVENLKMDFLAEQQALQSKYEYAVDLLRQAKDDLVTLGERNTQLEAELHRLKNPYDQAKPFTIRW